MKKVRWVLQKNLSSDLNWHRIKTVCQMLDLEVVEARVIPFQSFESPVDNEKTNIFYGSIQMIQSLMSKGTENGVFFDEKTFNMDNYLEKYGNLMLNSDARIITVKEFLAENNSPDSQWFIRPVEDTKAFDGEVRKFSEAAAWFAKIEKMYNNVNLSGETRILVSEPYSIKKEWRNFVVDGKVVASSQYRENFKLKKSDDVPKEVIDFVEKTCQVYSPHKIFAMDVALCRDEYYIVECGCFNNSGLYAADIKSLVRGISEYVEEHF